MRQIIIAKVFGEVLQNARSSKALSQAELAKRASLDRTYISMLERGLRAPSLPTIFVIAEGLGLQPNVLVSLFQDAFNKHGPITETFL